jgi:hypothetical protein
VEQRRQHVVSQDSSVSYVRAELIGKRHHLNLMYFVTGTETFVCFKFSKKYTEINCFHCLAVTVFYQIHST